MKKVKFSLFLKCTCKKDMFCLEPQTTIKKLMFGETTISYVKIGNHPIETTIYKRLALGFQVEIG